MRYIWHCWWKYFLSLKLYKPHESLIWSTKTHDWCTYVHNMHANRLMLCWLCKGLSANTHMALWNCIWILVELVVSLFNWNNLVIYGFACGILKNCELFYWHWGNIRFTQCNSQQTTSEPNFKYIFRVMYSRNHSNCTQFHQYRNACLWDSSRHYIWHDYLMGCNSDYWL